jgi:hypothetical protein
MDAPPVVDDARRCPDCGALVAADAEWCGQCFASLMEPGAQPQPTPEPEPTPEPGPEPTPGPPSEAEPSMAVTQTTDASTAVGATEGPAWPCPVCGNRNAIELDVCAVCGTPFATLMRQDEERPQVDPKDALAWSLIFPGLGHRKVGRGLDGLARGVLFGMLFSMAILTGLSGVRSGMLFGLFALFMGLALLVYAGSAWEAYHLAEGGEPVVSARALLWVTVGVILLSVVVLALTVVTAVRR